jgi:molybdopterin/thiamine biosynthesis adenylyltransferase
LVVASERLLDVGTERLRSLRALVVGAGTPGAIAAALLARAGVGSVGVVDDEPLDLLSEPGALAYLPADEGRNRAEALAERLGALAPEALVEPYPARIEPSNVEAIAIGSDVVLDCSGAPAADPVLSDACTALGIPLVHAELPPSAPEQDALATSGPAAVAAGALAARAALELAIHAAAEREAAI